MRRFDMPDETTNSAPVTAAILPFEPLILNDALVYDIGLFEQREVYRFYANERRKNCTLMEIMNLWLIVPYCFACALTESFDGIVSPYIRPACWEEDLRSHVGDGIVSEIERSRHQAMDFAFSCKRCGTELKPWSGDEMSVGSLHVEERFSIPMDVPGHCRVSRGLGERIKRLYRHRCFGCGKAESSEDGALHIDHIYPQSKGGTAAFRNLQPLCERCGNAKADFLPEQVDVYSSIFFAAPPSDAYEGLFW